MKIDFLSDINKGYETSLGYDTTDRFIVKVLWWHLGALILLAVTNAVLKLASIYPSPLSWRVITIPEAAVTILIAAAATLITILLKGRTLNHYLWRVIVTAALTTYSYLLVFISGGSIEMHFHFFIIAALLVIYADWRLGWVLLVLTGLHHGILNYVEPGWVYYYGRNDFAVIAHALPVLVTVIFTTVLCITSRRSVVDLKEAQSGLGNRTAELEKLKVSLEETVQSRTGELTAKGSELKGKVEELEKLNAMMVDRELKMVELKKENSELQAKLQKPAS